VAVSPRPGCLNLLFRAFLVLVALVLGVLAWDTWQLRTLRPPADATFDGFLNAGRSPLRLHLDTAADRLYWVAPPVKTVAPYSEWPLYEFDRSGRLVNWTPDFGNFKGMMQDTKMDLRGMPASMDEARAWLRKK
jgi:hypothetical protein